MIVGYAVVARFCIDFPLFFAACVKKHLCCGEEEPAPELSPVPVPSPVRSPGVDAEIGKTCKVVLLTGGVIIIVCTVVEDVITLGVGTLDDPVTLGVGCGMIGKACGVY